MHRARQELLDKLAETFFEARSQSQRERIRKKSLCILALFDEETTESDQEEQESEEEQEDYIHGVQDWMDSKFL